MILAIDPGPTKSAFVLWDGRQVHGAGWEENESIRSRLELFVRHSSSPRVAIEMIASYGMAVGASVFGTCVEIGRMVEVASRNGTTPELVFRRDVKLHVCGSARAKDANVRQALIDSLGEVGTKKTPGPLYGVKSHMWAALAVAVTAGAVTGPSGHC